MAEFRDFKLTSAAYHAFLKNSSPLRAVLHLKSVTKRKINLTLVN